MRTTSKVFKEQIQGHIKDILSKDFNTLPEQLQHVSDDFHNWYGPYEQKLKPNKQEAFIDWTWGLPSSFNAEYEYYRINETMQSWFEACGEAYKEPKDLEKSADFYKRLLYRELRTLNKKNGVEL